MRTFPSLSDEPNAFGFYEIRWSVRDKKGWRTKRKSTHAEDRQGAEIALAKFLSTRNADDDFDDITVSAVFDAYLELHSGPRGNRKGDEHCMRAPLLAFGDWSAINVSDQDVSAYVRRRAKGSYGKGAVASGTIRRELNALQAVLNFGSAKKMIRGGPVFRFTKPSDGPPRERWITEEQQGVILSQLHEASLSVRVFLRLALTYGVRKGAIMDLRFGPQINFISSTIDFNVPGARTTRKRRPVVPMTKSVRGDIEEIFKTKNAGDRLFPITTPAAYEKFMTSIKFAWVTPHVLKHSAITLMLRAGVQPGDVAKLTATDLRTIYRVYRHHTVDELKNIAEMRGV